MIKGTALLAALVGAVMLAPTACAAASKTIAEAASTDFRAELVAHRTTGVAAPSAAVTLVTYRRTASGW